MLRKPFYKGVSRTMLKKVWNVVSIMLVCVVAVLAILIAGVRLFGVQPYAVLSGSMSPAFPTGALIYVRAAQAQEVRVGDPITFRLEDGPVVATHRVISIDDENGCFHTKGDANEAPDGQPVYFDHLIGIPVFSIRNPVLARRLLV
jgi:signal peptidase